MVSKHRWFSGRMLACHAGGPGSIPGRCSVLFYICTAHDRGSSQCRWPSSLPICCNRIKSETLLEGHDITVLVVVAKIDDRINVNRPSFRCQNKVVQGYLKEGVWDKAMDCLSELIRIPEIENVTVHYPFSAPIQRAKLLVNGHRLKVESDEGDCVVSALNTGWFTLSKPLHRFCTETLTMWRNFREKMQAAPWPSNVKTYRSSKSIYRP